MTRPDIFDVPCGAPCVGDEPFNCRIAGSTIPRGETTEAVILEATRYSQSEYSLIADQNFKTHDEVLANIGIVNTDDERNDTDMQTLARYVEEGRQICWGKAEMVIQDIRTYRTTVTICGALAFALSEFDLLNRD